MRKPADLAQLIYQAFRSYREGFSLITHSAQQRFESANWLGVQSANTERLVLYNRHVLDICRVLRLAIRGHPSTAKLWTEIKPQYTKLLISVQDFELAETFYNSVYRDIFEDTAVEATAMFMHSSFASPPVQPLEPICRNYLQTSDLAELFRRLLLKRKFNSKWEDLDRDVANVCANLSELLPNLANSCNLCVRLLKGVFYRNKGAYLIGKLEYLDGDSNRSVPLGIAILQTSSRELYVDTLLSNVDEMSVLFSFTRAYFMVDIPCAYAVVNFLSDLLPHKTRSELYAAIGLHKHGKTSFYRDFLEHLENSDDKFSIAPGIKGMVMAVFLLPSYRTVFKIIKDHFPPQKNTTHEKVRHTYQVVKTHDRAGRMADTQEFENLSFPLARFDQKLLDELFEVAPGAVNILGDRLIIRHLYTERQMTPLNLYVASAQGEALTEVLDEYGNAIKQLAAANIFPGDMLLKNFGVTRHGRVVFYDYDEICYLTELNFRKIPEARTHEEEMSDKVWYSVAANDVFPEEFRHFLFGKPETKQRFREMHGELFEAEYWTHLQERLRAGEVSEVFPYRQRKRFNRSSGSSGDSSP